MIKKQPAVYATQEILLNAWTPPLFLAANPLGGNGGLTQIHATLSIIPRNKAAHLTAAGNPCRLINSVIINGNTTPPAQY